MIRIRFTEFNNLNIDMYKLNVDKKWTVEEKGRGFLIPVYFSLFALSK